MSSNQQQEPGLVTGHAKLAGGAVESALGNLTGQQSLQSAGEDLKQSGISELKDYQDKHPSSGATQGTAGKLEERIGSAVGCEGMVNDAQGQAGSTSSTSGPAGTINPSDSVTPGKIGGMEQPGLSTGGADPADGTRGNDPGHRLV